MGECPACYNEIPLTSAYCRVCGNQNLEKWAMSHRYAISLRIAIGEGDALEIGEILENIPPEIAREPEIAALLQEARSSLPSYREDYQSKLAFRIENFRDRWVGEIRSLLAEKRPNFILASQALENMPIFLRSEGMADLRTEIEERRKQLVEEGRSRKRGLLLQQTELLQAKGLYREAIQEIDKFLPALEDDSLLRKKEELQRTIAEIDKLKARLKGPDWALPGEAQKKTALQKKLPVAREFALAEGVPLCLILIPPGSFAMGSDHAYENERPAHKVEITQSYYLAISPITQRQWLAIKSPSPSQFQGDDLPVENLTWKESCDFAMALSKKFGEFFRLPTEAEWEYACRAESSLSYSFGEETSPLAEYAWFNLNSSRRSQPVCTLKPNKWGLYDMHGNVWEWCQDCYDEKYYAKSPAQNPMGPFGGANSPRVCRGGSWNSVSGDLRCSTRQGRSLSHRDSCTGFRPLLVPKKT
jgi:formylglycine-generating enzyme required for sulfatase activity